jgi:hypothetical protein
VAQDGLLDSHLKQLVFTGLHDRAESSERREREREEKRKKEERK